MTTEIILVFIILIAVLVLFATERLPADIVALLVLVVLVTVPVVKLNPAGGLVLAHYGLISTAEAFAGFASPAVLTVVAMFILSHGLVRAGVAYRIANGLRAGSGPECRVAHLAGHHRRRRDVGGDEQYRRDSHPDAGP